MDQRLDDECVERGHGGCSDSRREAAEHPQRRQRDQQRDAAEGGRFIPYPERWLKGRRWEDEVPPSSHTDARRLNDAWKDVQPGEVKL